jgi:hypothetical protein
MGSGVAPALWTAGKLMPPEADVCLWAGPTSGGLNVLDVPCVASAEHEQKITVQVKPHDRLVLVSSEPYGPSTPSLSTSWSRRGL